MKITNTLWSVIAAGGLCSALSAGCTTPAPPKIDATAAAQAPKHARLFGTWAFDLDATMDRCERIQAHDCEGWLDLSPEARTTARARYAQAFSRIDGTSLADGQIVFTPDHVRLVAWLGKTATVPYVCPSADGDVLTLDLENANKDSGREVMKVVFTGKDAFCFLEQSKRSDVFCFKRVAAP